MTPVTASSGWKRISPSVSPQISPTGRPRRNSPRAALFLMPPSSRARSTCSSCDHGKAYLSGTFRAACRSLGINLAPSHPDTPTDKPVIERTLGVGKVRADGGLGSLRHADMGR